MPCYRILDGVHRSVAAHKAGEAYVRARVDHGGALGPIELMSLDELYSDRQEIGRWDRGRDFLVLVSIVSDPIRRATLDPVIVAPVSDRVAAYLTAVPRVTVNPV